MLELLSFMYAGVGAMSVAGYVPQIIKLLKATGQSKAISLQSWAIWAFGNGISFLYAIFILKDLTAIVVIGGNFMGTTSVFCLASYNRFIRFCHEEIVIVHKPKEQNPEPSDRLSLDVA